MKKLTKTELKTAIVSTALQWRDLDESEPISPPSQKVNAKLKELAFLMDDYKKRFTSNLKVKTK